MIEFDYDKIIQPKTVVHCGTEEKANNLLAWADSIGKRWCSEQLFTNNNNWDDEQEDTCYDIYSGEYSRIGFCQNGYTVIPYEDALLNKEPIKIKPYKLKPY